MRWFNKLLVTLALLTIIGFSLGGVLVAFAYPQLPSLDVLTDYKPKVPLRVYTSDGALIGEFGEERRQVVKINQVPEVLKQAILAAEDDRFYEHSGVDLFGLGKRAAPIRHQRRSGKPAKYGQSRQRLLSGGEDPERKPHVRRRPPADHAHHPARAGS